MNHIAAALLLTLSDRQVNAKGIEEILSAAGSKSNKMIVDNILAATKGKSCEQIIAEGASRLATASGVSSSAPVEAKKDDKKDDKKGKKDAPKKDKKEKPKEESGSGGMDLF